MPIQQCSSGGKSGYKWGESGKCYTGPGARAKAGRQASAAYAHGYKGAMVELRKAVASLNKQMDSLQRLPAMGRRPDEYPEDAGGKPLYAKIED